MLIDPSQFPLIFLHPDIKTGHSAEAQLEDILDRGERFVLITDHTPTDDHDESIEERRRRALFFKRNRDRLRHLCLGAIVIDGEKPTSVPVRLAAFAFGKALGIDFHFVPAKALAIEQGLLLCRIAASNAGPVVSNALPE